MLDPIAQTNIDLYIQLHASGYVTSDLLRVRECYNFAMELFSDRFRANGKPFVSHLVGTASILAKLDARPSVVCAGLLHAAYATGNFSNSYLTIDDRRSKVRNVSGSETEDLVWRYNNLDWSAQGIERLAENFVEIGKREREIILLRLANELEDYLSLGMQFCNEGRQKNAAIEQLCINLAHLLIEPRLAEALEKVYREHNLGEWASSLARNDVGSFRVPSMSETMTGSDHLRAASKAAIKKVRKKFLKFL